MSPALARWLSLALLIVAGSGCAASQRVGRTLFVSGLATGLTGGAVIGEFDPERATASSIAAVSIGALGVAAVGGIMALAGPEKVSLGLPPSEPSAEPEDAPAPAASSGCPPTHLCLPAVP